MAGPQSTLKALSALMQCAPKRPSGSCFPHSHVDSKLRAVRDLCKSGVLSDHVALPALRSSSVLLLCVIQCVKHVKSTQVEREAEEKKFLMLFESLRNILNYCSVINSS